MLYTISLYVSLFLCIAGLIFRFCQWFCLKFGNDIPGISVFDKFSCAVTGFFKTLFSRKVFYLFYSVIIDLLFQLRLFKTGFFRWLMHFSIFAGFILLVVFHVFDETITRAVFPDYASTLNPFMFLRNLSGFFVLIGIIFSFSRRFFKDRLHLKNLPKLSNRADYFIFVLVAGIILSGFFLESAQIISERLFDDMVEDYSGIDDDDEIEALRAVWGKDFSVAFANPPDVSDKELFETGLEFHEDYCASCHTKPVAAFVSYSLAGCIKPFALFLNECRADIILWYIHFLSSFIALAVLPFTKAFHLVSTPLSLFLKRCVDGKKPPVLALKRAVELDACVHCGACSDVCSVGHLFNLEKNENILPSEKIRNIREMARGKGNCASNRRLLAGSMICSDCFRCNEVCPSGIDLRDIWKTAKDHLEMKGCIPPYKLVKEKTVSEWGSIFEAQGISGTNKDRIKEGNRFLKFIDDPEFFSDCLQCSSCANVCPVVDSFCPDADGKVHDPGMSPQQLMNFLRLGMKDMAIVSGLAWDCLACYMCQEHCPRNIPVTDIIFELRNQGFKRLESLETLDGKEE